MSTNIQFVDRVLELTNEHRANNGLNPLTLNQELNASAYGHSRDMAQQDFFDHTGADGSSFSDRNLEVGYASDVSAENIAAGGPTPEETVQQWIDSPGHNRNLLNPELTELGVGYFYLENDTGTENLNHYWTQVFGSGDTNPETNIPEDIALETDPAAPAVEPVTAPEEDIVIEIGESVFELEAPVIAPEDLAGEEIIGTEESDFLIGTEGNDSISGNGGDDFLDGYGGIVGEIDTLTGGAGADTFVIDLSIYAYAEDGNAIITDFEQGIDRLDLAGFEDLVTLGTSNGDNGVDTLISEGDDLLAVIQGVELSQDDFNNSIVQF